MEVKHRLDVGSA